MPNSKKQHDHSTDALLGELTADFAQRAARGENPSVEEYAQRHPEIAELIRDVFPLIDIIKQTATEVSAASSVEYADVNQYHQLGDFRLQREIGRGGMGVVFDALQISLDRRIALKVLPFGAVLNANQLQRFKNESRAAAGLHHPNIVPVYAVGCERGIHFFAMQFIEGRTLAEVIRKARDGEIRPTWQTISEWGIQIAEALEYAHTVGVVHRDIKPANLMVEAGGKVWITDFGLAQFESESALTMTGDIVGTLRYISPEQAQGAKGAVNHRSDVYSLGASLYELATLEPMFAGAERLDLLRCVKLVEPLAPRRIDSKIPIELETIILKAIEKEPGARYATAQELADDLRRFLQQRSILARRAGLLDRLAKWSRRNVATTRLMIAFLLLSALILGMAVWFVQHDRMLAVESLKRDAQRQLATHRYVAQISMAERSWKERQFEDARQYLRQSIPKPGEADLRGFEWYYLWQRTKSDSSLIG